MPNSLFSKGEESVLLLPGGAGSSTSHYLAFAWNEGMDGARD